jgi:hypothetical protein
VQERPFIRRSFGTFAVFDVAVKVRYCAGPFLDKVMIVLRHLY